MVAASRQAILDRVVVVGIGVLDHGSAAAVAALIIDELGIHHDLLAGRIGHAGAATGIGVGGIVGVAAREHGGGVVAGAAVDLLAEAHAAQEVLVIGHGRVPALGAVGVVDRQVVGRADGPHLCEALVLGVGVVLPVGVAIRHPVIAHTVLVLAVLILVAPGAAAAPRPGLGQPVVAEGGRGRLQGGRAAIGSQAGHTGHDLLGPGQVIGMSVVAGAGAVVGAEEGIVTVVGDIAIAIFVGRRAMRIVVGGGIADAPANPAVEIFVEVEVLPVGLPAVLLGAITGLVQAIVVGVMQRAAVAKGQAFERVCAVVLVDLGGGTHQEMLTGTVLLRQRVGIVADAEGGVLERAVGIAEIVLIGLRTAGGIGADIAVHGVQRQRTHDDGRLHATIGNRVVTAHGGTHRRGAGAVVVSAVGTDPGHRA